MTSRTIRSGALAVSASFDKSGHLVSVGLPANPPDGILAKDLSAVLSQLAEFELAYPQKCGPFVRRVWERLRLVPWGTAFTYRELAAELKNPNASRAVGQACSRNPLLLVVPCHRVVAESGLGGFAYGLEWKQLLLALETERP